MFTVGVTERGDAGLDLSWATKIGSCDITILITKNINNAFIDRVITLHNQGVKMIVHATCTGLGGYPVEKNVPPKEWTHLQVLELINKGFPVEQIVLRLDPIIPTDKGIKTAESVLNLFSDTGIKRVRYSFLDMYPHVAERFRKAGIAIPYNSFNAPQYMMNNAIMMLDKYSNKYEFESCAENTKHKLGCVSHKDLKIFNIEGNLIGSSNQRKTCLCVGNKRELLTRAKRCPHNCEYCFWKD